MSYVKTVWEDLPSRVTPINATRLNKLETQYDSVFGDAPFLNLNLQPGVDMTGNTECGAAVQTAIDLARTRGVPLIGTGQITSAIGLSIISDVDLTRVVLNYTGPSTSTAITVGNSDGIVRKDIRLPYVVNLNKAAGDTGWGGVGVVGTVGVSILNCGTCRITVPAIYKFETGLLVTGSTGRGSVYNTVDLGEIIDNKQNVKFVAPGGYTNQNTFLGGRVGHAAVDVSFKSGTRNILMANGTASEIAQGNTFLGTSLESPDFVEFQLECWGENNLFIDCSWETNTNTSRAAWRATAKNNQIIGGVQASTVIITADAGATANDVITSTRKNYSSTITFTGPSYDIGGTAAAGADQPRYLRVNTAVQTGYGATHGSAATAGIGAFRYDTAREKPLFSNGGAWYRADSYLKSVKTASYTILTTDAADAYIFNGTSLTATLPDPGNAAQDVRITIKNIAATALTVNSAGTSKTLDGAASQSLAQWAKATYVSDGTQWLTV